MTKLIRPFLLSIVMACVASGSASAHTGAIDHSSFLQGLLHPVSGVDHVLTMVTIGLLAAQLGGRLTLALPAVFMGMMGVGGGLEYFGYALPLVEHGIAASVFVLAALVTLGMRVPSLMAVAVAGAFAVFHGYAHLSELPVGGSALTFAAGFLATTALLHGLGVTIGATMNAFSASQGKLANPKIGAVFAFVGLSYFG